VVLFGRCVRRAPRRRVGLAGQIDGWFESRPVTEKSLLFAEWIMGAAEGSKADELFGSLGIVDRRSNRDSSDSARKKAYTAMLATIVLDERSRGVPLSEIERRWQVSGLEGIEEAWRDTALWLLSGHARSSKSVLFTTTFENNAPQPLRRSETSSERFVEFQGKRTTCSSN
jgi:hypothetical protein